MKKTKMYIYLIMDENIRQGRYDHAIVCAASETEARRIHPNGREGGGYKWDGKDDGTWIDADKVGVICLGVAIRGMSMSTERIDPGLIVNHMVMNHD